MLLALQMGILSILAFNIVIRKCCELQGLCIFFLTEKVHYPLFILAKQVHCLMAEDLNTALTFSIFYDFHLCH